MTSSPDAQEMLYFWLESHDFDGLRNSNLGCGCLLDGLVPSDDCDLYYCQAAYRHNCGAVVGDDKCDSCRYEPGDAQFCMRLERP